jgi:hypothetical protein
MPTSDPRPEQRDASKARTASLRQVLGAVFWSFFGVRKRAAMTQDLGAIRPHQVIIVGIIFAAIFVVTLVLVTRLIVRLAG